MESLLTLGFELVSGGQYMYNISANLCALRKRYLNLRFVNRDQEGDIKLNGNFKLYLNLTHYVPTCNACC